MSLPNGNVCRVVVEDCRDFLRTGRCKYGSSCKYNHPANVQNGGGIKPLDPSEPMFPVRPNEPFCQYYMKHGTCKFGQACKFNHPPQSNPPLTNGGMNGSHNSRRTEPAAQLLLNPVGPDPSGQRMMMQFLPQRPEQADCIYFLKNGRCKYGATCRYHHPIHPQQPRTRLDSRTSRVRQDSFGRGGGNKPVCHKVQYVTQVIHKYPTVVSTEGSGMVTMDGSNSQSQGYGVSSGDTIHSFAYQGSSVVMTEQSSSTSSMASSFETNQDMLGEGNRPRRNVSVGSFNNSDAAPRNNNMQQQPLVFMPHSISDGNMRRGRAASYGNIRDTSPPNFDPRSWSHRSPGAPRQPPDASVRAKAPTQNGSSHRGTPSLHVNPPGAPDEGFTRMTSALLNMLDTTEEILGESHSDEELQLNSNLTDPEILFDRLTISPRNQQHQQPFQNHHRNIMSGNNAGFRPIPQEEYNSQFTTNSSPHQELDGWKPAWQFSGQQAPRHSAASTYSVASSSGTAAPVGPDIGLFLP